MRRCVGYCVNAIRAVRRRLRNASVGIDHRVRLVRPFEANGAHQQLVRVGHHIEDPSRMLTLASLEATQGTPSDAVARVGTPDSGTAVATLGKFRGRD